MEDGRFFEKLFVGHHLPLSISILWAYGARWIWPWTGTGREEDVVGVCLLVLERF